MAVAFPQRSSSQPAGRATSSGAPFSHDAVAVVMAAVDAALIVLLGLAVAQFHGVVAPDHASAAQAPLRSSLAIAVVHTAFSCHANAYNPATLAKTGMPLRLGLTVWTASFGAVAVLAFLLREGGLFSRGEMALFYAVGAGSIVVIRRAMAQACNHIIASGGLLPRRIVAVGTVDEIARNETLSSLGAHGYCLVRAFTLETSDWASRDAFEERIRKISDYVRRAKIDEIMLVLPWDRLDLIAAAEKALIVLPLPVRLVPDTTASRILIRPWLDIGPTVAIEIQRAPLTLRQQWAKQLFDQTAAAIALVLLAPFLVAIAIAIRLESPGPALFKQTRVGLNGCPFRIYKFRSMTTLDDGPVIQQATRNDPRVTRLGRLLRSTSIDELPQLFNVLLGDMSLVGPRPHALAHDNQYDRLIARYAMRRKMRPGITGWAQVNGYRGETRETRLMEKRVENDLWYIEYWSFWLDLQIILLTIVRLMRSPAAY